jgi:hypothetical protein
MKRKNKAEKSEDEKSEDEKLRELHLQMGKTLIENDEKNQTFKLVDRVGRILMKPISFWRRFFWG